MPTRYLTWLAISNIFCIIADTQSQGTLPEDVLQKAVQSLPSHKTTALNLLRDTLKMESMYGQQMRRFGRNGARRQSFRFVQGFLGLTPHGKHMSLPAFFQAKTLSLLRSQFRLDNRQMQQLIRALPPPFVPQTRPFVPDTRHPPLEADVCPYPRFVQCNPGAPYRTYDGTCNNVQNPMWGSTHMPLVRFLPSQYADGIEAPRVSVTGVALPSARLISSTIHWDIDIPHHIHTLMVMQFGQFLDHDLSRTAITKLTMDPLGRGDDLEEVECGFDGCQTSGLENEACLPIHVPFNDTEYGRQQPCLMFVRSLQVPNADCRFGPREQLNQITSHLDASHIYGSAVSEARGLRDLARPDRGRMIMKAHPAGPTHSDLLPQDPDFKDCKGDNSTFLCFKAGDGRVNEFMGLTTLHMVWAREHNRVEGILHQLNPHWNGDRLYEETKRIITAVWQWIIYNEYLPIILGPKIMSHYGLNMPAQGHWNGYNPRINPSVANVFATAAMRFGHTQIQGVMEGKDVDYNTREFIPISTQMRRPHLMYRPSAGGCDAMLRGLIGTSSQTRDPFITKQVSRHLFADEPPTGLGEDLMSLNMQRAREHGIPGYNYWRQWCGLKSARTFEELSREIPSAVLLRFKRLYRHVDDIDLWPAAISEASYPSSLLGPTFACILATQFRNLKFGDRFWFENNRNNPHPFNNAQLHSIKQMTLSKLICTNSDTINSIQPHVLVHPLSKVQENIRDQGRSSNLGEFTRFYQAASNERVPCQSLPDIDFRAWQEPAPIPRPNNFRPQTQQFRPQPTNLQPPQNLQPPPPPQSIQPQRNNFIPPSQSLQHPIQNFGPPPSPNFASPNFQQIIKQDVFQLQTPNFIPPPPIFQQAPPQFTGNIQPPLFKESEDDKQEEPLVK